MASDIWLRTILIVRKETRCRHIGYSYRLTARVLLYTPSNRQDNTYHGLCYTSRGALAGTRNSSMGPPHEGSLYLWATSRSLVLRKSNALTTELLKPTIINGFDLTILTMASEIFTSVKKARTPNWSDGLGWRSRRAEKIENKICLEWDSEKLACVVHIYCFNYQLANIILHLFYIIYIYTHIHTCTHTYSYLHT